MNPLSIKLLIRTSPIVVRTEGGVIGGLPDPSPEEGITCQGELVSCQAETVTNDFE